MTILLLLSLLVPPLTAGGGLTPADYFSFRFVGDPLISPDGRLVAFPAVQIDTEKNRRHSSIWLVGVDGDPAPRQFTTGASSANAPAWSPDGSELAFLSARDGGKAQVWALPMRGGEARRLTDLANGVSAFQWSPDGARPVVVSRKGPSDARASKNPSDVRHYTTLWYKFNDTGWYDDKRSHLWVVDLKSGQAAQITDGDAWNDTEPQFSPDGARIAFVSNRTGKELDGSRDLDVWVIPAGGGPLTKISNNPEADRSPRWSPDGSRIAWAGDIDRNSHVQVYTAPPDGKGQPSVVCPALDQDVSGMTWAEKGSALYFTSQARGEEHVFRIQLDNRRINALTSGPRMVQRFAVHDAKLVYTANDFRHLDELFSRSAAGGEERPLTRFNEEFLKQRELASVERFPYTARDGTPVEGFLIRPLDFQPGKKYPMVLTIHGGPNGMYGLGWMQEFQVYAARGWVVLATNPRGSSGYGRKFQRAVEKEWGGKTYTDIMDGVNTALEKFPYIDRDRLGVTGGSFGGFMTNWITSHTNIFKAAVTVRCISNLVSGQGTRDAAYGHDRDFGGDLFQNYDLYWEYSPLKHVRNVKTPTLVIHSDADHRTPIEQGEQWYRALKYLGVTTELVIFPRENHNLTRSGEPRHLVEHMEWQVYWFDRFLNGNAFAKRPSDQ